MAFLELLFRKDFAVEGAIFPLNLEGRKLFHWWFLSEAESWPQHGLSKYFLLWNMLINHKFHNATYTEFMMAIVCPLQLGLLKGFVTEILEVGIIFGHF